MTIIFYSIDKIISSFRLPLESEKLFTLSNVDYRASVNMLAPILIFTNKSGDNIESANYVYIVEWKRYYFIHNLTVQGNLYQLHCDIDVLASWRETILSQTFYVERAVNFCDNSITDTVYPTSVVPVVKSEEFENQFAQVENGIYVLAIASGGNESSRVGCNVYYIISPSEMEYFMQTLMNSSDFTTLAELGENIIKAIVNPLSYIQSCIWLPIEKAAVTTKKASTIDFGWYSVDCSCDILDVNSTTDTFHRINKDLIFEDNFIDAERIYDMYPPYSQYNMILPPFGSFPLPPELIKCIVSDMQITVEIDIDILTGMALLKLKNTEDVTLYISTVQLGVEIAVGDIIQDYAGAAISAVNAVSSALSGNVASTLNGVVSGIESASPAVSVNGACGGYALLDLTGYWTVNRVYYKPIIKPDYKGEPYCAMSTLENMEGYVRCSDVHVKGAMLTGEKELIEQFLTKGCFVE